MCSCHRVSSFLLCSLKQRRRKGKEKRREERREEEVIDMVLYIKMSMVIVVYDIMYRIHINNVDYCIILKCL